MSTHSSCNSFDLPRMTTMIMVLTITLLFSGMGGVQCAFSSTSTSSFSGTSMVSGAKVTTQRTGRFLSMEYIPSGLSKEQWQKIKAKEQTANKGKNLGAVGITTFKSRTFLDWQKSGGKNLFPVDPTKEKDPSKIPYMQRPGGASDDSDLVKSKPLNLFGGITKKKTESKKQDPPPKSTNWWTLK